MNDVYINLACSNKYLPLVIDLEPLSERAKKQTTKETKVRKMRMHTSHKRP